MMNKWLWLYKRSGNDPWTVWSEFPFRLSEKKCIEYADKLGGINMFLTESAYKAEHN